MATKRFCYLTIFSRISRFLNDFFKSAIIFYFMRLAGLFSLNFFAYFAALARTQPLLFVKTCIPIVFGFELIGVLVEYLPLENLFAIDLVAPNDNKVVFLQSVRSIYCFTVLNSVVSDRSKVCRCTTNFSHFED